MKNNKGERKVMVCPFTSREKSRSRALVSSVIRKHTTREPGAFSGGSSALPETAEQCRGEEKEEVRPQKICIMYSFL